MLLRSIHLALFRTSILIFLALPVFGEAPVSLSDWEIQRSRYGKGTFESQTVTMAITVNHTGGEKLSSAKARLIFYTEKGKKIRTSKWKQIGNLQSSNSKRLDFKEGKLAQFPAFGCEVSYYLNGKRTSNYFHSSNHMQLPQLIPEEPYEGISQLLIMGQQIELSSVGNTKPKVSLWVRNIGALDSISPEVSIDLLGRGKKVSRTVKHPLVKKGKDLGSGEDVYVDIVFKKSLPSEFSGYKISLADQTPEPANDVISFDESFAKGEVSLGKFKFTYAEDGSLKGDFSILNDTNSDVAKLDAIVNLLDADDKAVHAYSLPLKDLKAGEERKLEVNSEKGLPFEYLDFGITTYEEHPVQPSP